MPIRTPKKTKTLTRTPSCTDEVNDFQKQVSLELVQTNSQLREIGGTFQADVMQLQEELHAKGKAKSHAVGVLKVFLGSCRATLLSLCGPTVS